MNNLQQLSQSIFEKSVISTESIRDNINYESVNERNMMWTYIVFEFIYLFIHLTSREIFSSNLKEQRQDIINKLSSIIVDTAINTLYEDLPKDKEKDARDSFFNRLQIAELEYGACSQLLDKEIPFSDEAVLSLFGKNICKLANAPENLEVMMKAITLGMHNWIELRPQVLL